VPIIAKPAPISLAAVASIVIYSASFLFFGGGETEFSNRHKIWFYRADPRPLLSQVEKFMNEKPGKSLPVFG
jgi:hypothetical protein